jgi:hypothetical protein
MAAAGVQTCVVIVYLLSVVVLGATVLGHRLVAAEGRRFVVRAGVGFLLVTVATGALVLGGNLSGEPCGPSALDVVREWSLSAFEPSAQPVIARCIAASRMQLAVAASVQVAASLALLVVVARVARRSGAPGPTADAEIG